MSENARRLKLCGRVGNVEIMPLLLPVCYRSRSQIICHNKSSLFSQTKRFTWNLSERKWKSTLGRVVPSHQDQDTDTHSFSFSTRFTVIDCLCEYTTYTMLYSVLIVQLENCRACVMRKLNETICFGINFQRTKGQMHESISWQWQPHIHNNWMWMHITDGDDDSKNSKCSQHLSSSVVCHRRLFGSKNSNGVRFFQLDAVGRYVKLHIVKSHSDRRTEEEKNVIFFALRFGFDLIPRSSLPQHFHRERTKRGINSTRKQEKNGEKARNAVEIKIELLFNWLHGIRIVNE